MQECTRNLRQGMQLTAKADCQAEAAKNPTTKNCAMSRKGEEQMEQGRKASRSRQANKQARAHARQPPSSSAADRGSTLSRRCAPAPRTNIGPPWRPIGGYHVLVVRRSKQAQASKQASKQAHKHARMQASRAGKWGVHRHEVRPELAEPPCRLARGLGLPVLQHEV